MKLKYKDIACLQHIDNVDNYINNLKSKKTAKKLLQLSTR